MAIKSPTYSCFVEFLHEQKLSNWDPQDHEAWELPPSQFIRLFFTLFPPGEDSEVVDFISKKARNRILNYIKQKGEM